MATPLRILVVEDEERIRQFLQRGLSYEGYRVDIAEDGQTGLEIARDQPPDLVLLDIHLPDVDGLSVCHELNDAADTCDIPVIVLSAMERPDIIRRSRAAGSHYFLRKPYDPNALLMLAEAAMNTGQELD